jgi:hypothetical protein
MEILPIHNDLVFKLLFSRDPEILLDLLNSFPDFKGKRKIKKLKILNPILLPSKKNYRRIITYKFINMIKVFFSEFITTN